MWYPAEAGIEPGQIWLYDGTLRRKFADKPATLATNLEPAVIDDRNWSQYGEVETSFRPEFTNSTISKAGPFGSELYAATVRKGTVKFSQPRVVSLNLPDLSSDASVTHGSGYTRAIELAREGRPGLHVVASVVQVDRAIYMLYCEDPHQLVRRLPRLRELTNAQIDVEVVDNHYARMTCKPPEGAGGLVLGVLPLRGEALDRPLAESRRLSGAQLKFAARQSYAFPSEMTLTEGGKNSLTLPDDLADEVDAKYRRATGSTVLAGGKAPVSAEQPKSPAPAEPPVPPQPPEPKPEPQEKPAERPISQVTR